MIQELLTGAGVAVLIAPLSAWLGKVWAARILEKDRVRYQMQMEMTLQDVRTRSSKELFVHQLQFEKEFQVYLDLWKEVLSVGRAASEFRELKMDSGKSPEEQSEQLLQALKQLNSRVYDHRPFYTPEVYEFAKDILKKSGQVLRLHSMGGQARDPWEKSEALLDEINAAIDPLCDAIRRRIWPG